MLEINYGIIRSDGDGIANEIMGNIYTLPLKIIDKIDADLFKWASFFKSKYKISLADSFALGLSKIKKAKLVTSDQHEFDIIDKDDIIELYWIR